MKKLISIKTIRETDTSPDLSYLGEYKSKPSATTIDREERGDCWRHEYRYWEPCNNHAALGEWEHVSDNAVNDSFLRLPLELRQTLTESTRLAKIAIIGAYYTEQDYLRHEAYNKGEWCCVGVEAVAEYTLNDTIQKMRSGGLYGIESDSGEGYFQEVEAEQLEELKGKLVAIGFTVEEIDAYLTNEVNMNNSKHIPGPWTVGGQKIVQDPRNGANIGTQVIETSLGEIELIDGTNEPDYNARLIAAAPCILDVLTRLVEKVKRANAIQHSGGQVIAEDWSELYQLQNEAQSVIKQAKGV